MRCPHGFEVSLVACPVGCGGKRPEPLRKNVDQAKRPDARVDAIAQEVAAELSTNIETIVAPSASWARSGGSTVVVKARAEIAKRAAERHRLNRSQVARALGVRIQDITYAIKRCA